MSEYSFVVMYIRKAMRVEKIYVLFPHHPLVFNSNLNPTLLLWTPYVGVSLGRTL